MSKKRLVKVQRLIVFKKVLSLGLRDDQYVGGFRRI